jgi:archaellum component FlaD/FlaE
MEKPHPTVEDGASKKLSMGFSNACHYKKKPDKPRLSDMPVDVVSRVGVSGK